jgi:ribosomal protein S18 acetylase RimI-like enzyme
MCKTFATDVEDTPEYLAIFNVDNPNHHQSNFACRFRLKDEQSIDGIIGDLEQNYRKDNLVPRFFVDERATPSMDAFENHFKKLGSSYTIEHCTDVIMKGKRPDQSIDPLSMVKNLEAHQATSASTKTATMDDLDALVRVFSEAFGYQDDTEWLQIKLAKQLSMPDQFKATVTQIHTGSGETVITSASILYLPLAYPDLALLQTVGSDPKYQRSGLATASTLKVLQDFAGNRTVYLEVYDDIRHAQKLYQQIGFEVAGEFKFFRADGIQTTHLI